MAAVNVNNLGREDKTDTIGYSREMRNKYRRFPSGRVERTESILVRTKKAKSLEEIPKPVPPSVEKQSEVVSTAAPPVQTPKIQSTAPAMDIPEEGLSFPDMSTPEPPKRNLAKPVTQVKPVKNSPFEVRDPNPVESEWISDVKQDQYEIKPEDLLQHVDLDELRSLYKVDDIDGITLMLQEIQPKVEEIFKRHYNNVVPSNVSILMAYSYDVLKKQFFDEEVREYQKKEKEAAAGIPEDYQKQREALVTSEIEGFEVPERRGVNPIEVVVFKDGSKAILKPDPSRYSDNHKSEVCASIVAGIIGFSDLVPPTSFIGFKGNRASIQKFSTGKVAFFVDQDKRYGKLSDTVRAFIFDYLICNNDRHNGNWLVDKDDKLVLIDNGDCFPEYGSMFSKMELKVSDVHVPKAIVKHIQSKVGQIREAMLKLGFREENIASLERRVQRLVWAADETYTFSELIDED